MRREASGVEPESEPRRTKHVPIEDTAVYRRATAAADQVWHIIIAWEWFAKRTTGAQLLEAIDSVGANLVEGDGRYSDAEAIHFFVIARGSLREALHWIRVAARRELIAADVVAQLEFELTECRRMLNGLINYRRETKNVNMVREERAAYDVGPEPSPFTPHALRLTPSLLTDEDQP